MRSDDIGSRAVNVDAVPVDLLFLRIGFKHHAGELENVETVAVDGVGGGIAFVRQVGAERGKRPVHLLMSGRFPVVFRFRHYALSRCASAALTNPRKSGCAFSGVDLNSGWNWQATNHG